MKIALSLLAVIVSAASPLVAAVDLPKLKPGLWEMTTHSGAAQSASPGIVCVGAMSDQPRRLEQVNIKSRCSQWESRQVGGNLIIDAVCTSPRGVTLNKHTVSSLSGETFREDNTAPQGTMTSEGKWLSACKPGQTPDVFK